MAQVGKDLRDHLVPTPLQGRNPLEQPPLATLGEN